jgi:hypothetical protein
MSHPPTLDYEPPKPLARPRWLPVDWRRRLRVGGVVALSVFAMTFEVARRVQSPVIALHERYPLRLHMDQMQHELNGYIRSTGQVPATLRNVPAINNMASKFPPSVSDQWGHP